MFRLLHGIWDSNSGEAMTVRFSRVAGCWRRCGAARRSWRIMDLRRDYVGEVDSKLCVP
jgi:hypothetical protein